MNKKYGKIIFCFLLLAFPFTAVAQNEYPMDVQAVLNQTKTNRSELEKFINHFTKPADSLKFKAACFLVSNMDIHSSQTYFWADSIGQKIEFDELKYQDFSASLKAFDSLKKSVSKIHPVSYSYRDIDTLKSTFLIENMNQAFFLWQQPYAKNISFNDFCEYLLPYRTSIEPVQNWRSFYAEKFSPVIKSHEPVDSALLYVKKNLTYWFTCTYNLEKRADPIPRLGALQLLLRKKGPCEDVAGLGVFTLRSLGIPASIDFVPAWATSSGNHTLNVALSPEAVPIHYDLLLTSDSVKDFIREPAKVIRSLYSKQKNALPYFEDINNIPSGFMRLTNYKDVTAEYWQTENVKCKLFKIPAAKKIAYAAVLNYGKWEAAWWGFIQNDSVVFTNMCKGAVFLPMYYSDNKLNPAGYPVVSGYAESKTLIPDTVNTTTMTLKEQANYLRFRIGKKYKLYYWNYSWRLVGEKTTDEKTMELSFDNVPKNALYILIPEYSQRKERPFSFSEKGDREWW